MARRWRADANRWSVLKPLAQKHRQVSTPAERVLWQAIRGGKLGGFRFRRQHAVETYIADFYCREAGLVIEVDGSVHETSGEDDRLRQAVIEAQGLTVLRFTNEAVLTRLDDVLQAIREKLPVPNDPGPPAVPPLRSGEGARG
jgi:5-methyltetrahydrofolate--homocysteine methyltransferase